MLHSSSRHPSNGSPAASSSLDIDCVFACCYTVVIYIACSGRPAAFACVMDQLKSNRCAPVFGHLACECVCVCTERNQYLDAGIECHHHQCGRWRVPSPIIRRISVCDNARLMDVRFLRSVGPARQSAHILVKYENARATEHNRKNRFNTHTHRPRAPKSKPNTLRRRRRRLLGGGGRRVVYAIKSPCCCINKLCADCAVKKLHSRNSYASTLFAYRYIPT